MQAVKEKKALQEYVIEVLKKDIEEKAKNEKKLGTPTIPPPPRRRVFQKSGSKSVKQWFFIKSKK